MMNYYMGDTIFLKNMKDFYGNVPKLISGRDLSLLLIFKSDEETFFLEKFKNLNNNLNPRFSC